MVDNKVMENKFEKALKNNEINDFINGNGEYFVLDREYGGHSCLGSYKLFVEPYLYKNNSFFEMFFWKELGHIFINEKDKNIFLDNLVGYLIPYYSEKSDIRKENTPSSIIEIIRSYIDNNKNSLKMDKRGSGIEWNSNQGLYESILQNLEIILKRGGPDFIPRD